MPPVALTIAGSDPSGGAGIQADLRTFDALHVTGLSVVTALTVQNSHGVWSVHPVSSEIVAAQLDAILSDTRPQAVKIGMLGGAEQVRVVADALRRHRPPNIILDPVRASTGGVPLLDEAGQAALISDLLPLCDLVTPNQDEGPWLAGLDARAVLLKGGHLNGAPLDVLTLADGTRHEFVADRIDTPHTHGTGCFLSAAIAGLLAHGLTLTAAIAEAKILLTCALQTPIVIGTGRGYPSLAGGESYDERLRKLLGVYVVTDTQMRPERSHENIVRAALAGGARVIQIRDKHLPARDLAATVERCLRLTRASGALLIVNDRVDVALAADADGVHLGPDDLAPADARRLLGRGKLVGVSVATIEEAERAAPWTSYFGVGAIYGTQTKLDAGTAIGAGRITQIKAAFPCIPLVAIGGINADNIGAVAQAGADAAAVVSAVVAAPDMEAATRELCRLF